jgi:hypothetical protein
MSARYLLAFVCVALLLTVAAGQTCCDTEKGCGKAGTKEDCAAVCDITAGNAQVCKENCATSVQCTCSWYNNQCRDAVQLASQGLSDLVGGAVGLAMWLLVLLIAVPAVILLLIIICIVWCCCCRNKGQVQ